MPFGWSSEREGGNGFDGAVARALHLLEARVEVEGAAVEPVVPVGALLETSLRFLPRVKGWMFWLTQRRGTSRGRDKVKPTGANHNSSNKNNDDDNNAENTDTNNNKLNIYSNINNNNNSYNNNNNNQNNNNNTNNKNNDKNIINDNNNNNDNNTNPYYSN